MQYVAVRSQRRAVDSVSADIARPRQVPVPAGTRRGADDAAAPQSVAVVAPFRRPDHPRTVHAGDKITDVVDGVVCSAVVAVGAAGPHDRDLFAAPRRAVADGDGERLFV